MDKRLILITHAGMAKGVKETLEFISGFGDQAEVIEAFTEDKQPELRFRKLLEETGEDCLVIVLTDIEFGSVNQMCSRYAGERVHLITGFNLPLAVELYMTPAEQIDSSFIRTAIEKAKREMMYMNDVISELKQQGKAEENPEEDFF
ncbi:MAG: hypothetical protein LIP16_06770 [Clostridium sp.]|nr:hypothetical protein [Clostridium sp.]